jgi:hypothetical protein
MESGSKITISFGVDLSDFESKLSLARQKLSETLTSFNSFGSAAKSAEAGVQTLARALDGLQGSAPAAINVPVKIDAEAAVAEARKTVSSLSAVSLGGGGGAAVLENAQRRLKTAEEGFLKSLTLEQSEERINAALNRYETAKLHLDRVVRRLSREDTKKDAPASVGKGGSRGGGSGSGGGGGEPEEDDSEDSSKQKKPGFALSDISEDLREAERQAQERIRRAAPGPRIFANGLSAKSNFGDPETTLSISSALTEAQDSRVKALRALASEERAIRATALNDFRADASKENYTALEMANQRVNAVNSILSKEGPQLTTLKAIKKDASDAVNLEREKQATITKEAESAAKARAAANAAATEEEVKKAIAAQAEERAKRNEPLSRELLAAGETPVQKRIRESIESGRPATDPMRQLRRETDEIGSSLLRATNRATEFGKVFNRPIESRDSVLKAMNGKPLGSPPQGLEGDEKTAPNRTRHEGFGNFKPYEVTNLAYQVNDVFSGLAMGQGAFTILAQQGGQFYQIMSEAEGGLKSSFKSIGQAILGLLSPTNAALAAFASIGALGVYNLYKVISEAQAAKAAVQGLAGAVAAAGNAGNFKSLTSDLSAFVNAVGPAARTRLLGEARSAAERSKTPVDDISPSTARLGMYAPGQSLTKLRLPETLSAQEAQEFGSRVAAMKGSSRELLLSFGELALGIRNIFPSDYKNKIEELSSGLEDPDKKIKELTESTHNLTEAERERIAKVLRYGTLDEKRAEAIALVGRNLAQESSATILAAEAQRVKGLGARDVGGALAALISKQESLLSSGQQLLPMEGVLSDQFSSQIKKVNELREATERLAESRRATPQTREEQIERASGVATQVNPKSQEIEKALRDIQELYRGLGAKAPTNAGDAVGVLDGLLGKSENDPSGRAEINRVLKEAGRNIDSAVTPWCAAMVSAGLKAAGIAAISEAAGGNIASSYARWGRGVDTAREKVARGDVVVMYPNGPKKPGETGAHVGFATGESRTGENGKQQIEVISGNEGDKVAKSWRDAGNVTIRRATEAEGAGAGDAIPTKPDDVSQEKYDLTVEAIRKRREELKRLRQEESGTEPMSRFELERAQQRVKEGENEVETAKKKLAVLRDIARDKTGEDKVKADRDVAEAELDIKKKTFEVEKARNQLEVSKIGKSDPSKRRELQINGVRRDLEQNPNDPKTQVEAQQRLLEIEQEFAETSKTIKRNAEQTKYEIAKDALDRQKQIIEQDAASEKITQQEKFSRLRENLQQRIALDQEHNTALQASYVDDAVKYQEYENKRTQIAAQAAQERKALNRKELQDTEQQYRGVFDQIGSTVSSAVMGMIQGTMSFRDAMRSIALQVVNMFLNAGIKMVANWLAQTMAGTAITAQGEAAKTTAVTVGAAARQGAETTAASGSLFMIIPNILKSIFASAAQTFAGIFGFLSPVMGPAAAGPALAGQAAVLGVATALPAFAIGSWELPGDMIAQVHKGEMIVPAAQTPWAQALMANGGPVAAGARAGGDVHVHVTHAPVISAIDGASVKSMYRNSERILLRQLNDAARRGAHLGLSELGKA